MGRKTEFELEDFSYGKPFQRSTISIIGQRPVNDPYVNINLIDAEGRNFVFGIQDKDLERFAVNVLKALGSKKLAENAEPKVVYIDPRNKQ